ncbi:hypothetical protein [Burkholderia sp. HI2500]|nr:hypothetical protein [Burkholderia sp. HI2500]
MTAHASIRCRRSGAACEHAVDGLDGVRWRVGKTVILDAQGNAVQTIG